MNMTPADLRRASTQQIAGLNFVKDSYPFEDELKNERKPLDRVWDSFEFYNSLWADSFVQMKWAALLRYHHETQDGCLSHS